MSRESDLQWCRATFAALAEGGRWGVPRSGLIFEKREGELVLVERMPWSAELAQAAAEAREVPPDEAALRAYQDEDAALIRSRLEAAGIPTRNAIGGTNR
jgi:hypothetical protein